MELSDEEKEIIRRYRQLSDSKKEAVLASENSFFSWIKTAIKWVWERIVQAAPEIITGIFYYLRKYFFGI